MITTLRQYKVGVLVTFSPAGRTVAQRRIAGGRTCCVVIQPRDRIYLPAVIWGLKSSLRGQEMSAVVSLTLVDGEAEDYFSVGQSFTIWSDVLVGDSIRGEGLVGQGAISTRESPSPTGRKHRPHAKAAAVDRQHRRSEASTSAPAGSGADSPQ